MQSQTSFQFDELCSSYEQVQGVSKCLAHKFVNSTNTHKVVLNLVDQFSTDNNAGFNLANFKPRLIRDYYQDVVTDYERSFIGAFAHALFQYPVCQPDSP